MNSRTRSLISLIFLVNMMHSFPFMMMFILHVVDVSLVLLTPDDTVVLDADCFDDVPGADAHCCSHCTYQSPSC